MNLLGFLIIASIVLLITIYFIKKERILNRRILIALIGMTIALTILIFPLYRENNLLSQIIFSILYAAQVTILSQDFELIRIINPNNIINTIYIVMVYSLFLLEPLATATALLSILGNNLSKMKMSIHKNKQAIVFSEINNKTIKIAKKQYIKNKTLIIFLAKKEENEQYRKEITQLKGIILDQKITNLNLKNNEISYYIFSRNEEKNLNDALELLKQNCKQKTVKIYVLNNREQARTILDSCPKNGARLELINEADRMIYQLLYDNPIYKESINNQISILIVGCGKVGIEFLKAVTWCGQLINHKLNINVIDTNANQIKEKLDRTCPELLSNYQYNFIEADIYSKKAIDELDKLKEQNINYILVALENENLNIEVATLLRKYFLQQDTNSYSRMPVINLWIEDDDKKIQVDLLKHSNETNSYKLNAFGSVNEMYGDKSIVNSEIEKLAMQVHAVYDSDDIKNNLARFYELEYNKKSSRAVGVHLKYKLYSVLKDNYNGDLESDLDNNIEKVLLQYREIAKNKQIIQSLIENEHERWNAYVRTDGYKTIEKEEVKKYIKSTKKNKHVLAKLHPAIVPFEKLEEVGAYIKEDLISPDKNIISNIEKILKKEIYK